MTDSQQFPPYTVPTTDPAERLAEYLLSYPADLVDSYRLLRRFRVTSEDFFRALALAEQRIKSDPAERLAEHLLSYPADLVDSYRLLRRFQASNEDFQRALRLVDQRTPLPTSQGDA
jgi:tetratricopeptide (TPR) repeat protein